MFPCPKWPVNSRLQRTLDNALEYREGLVDWRHIVCVRYAGQVGKMAPGDTQEWSSNSTAHRLTLLGILGLAISVRFWGITFGLPSRECNPDEAHIIRTALRFASGDLNPHAFSYPTLYMYLLFFLYGCYYLLGILSGRFSSRADILSEYVRDPSAFYLIDRAISALLGVATVWLVYRICARSIDRRVGLVAALYLSIAHLHVRDSHFGVTDVPMVFFIMGSILFISRIHTEPNRRNYFLAGVFAGLAMSTKYSGLFLAVPLVLSHVLDVRPPTDSLLGSLTDRRILVFGLGLALSFVAGTPFAVLDFPALISGILFEMRHLASADRINLGRGWLYHLQYTLRHGLGLSLLVASLLGVWALARRNPRRAIILCSFPIIYYGIAGSGFTVFLRYMLPVIPFLCMTAAVFTLRLADAIVRGRSFTFRNATTMVLACLVAAPSVDRVIRSDSLLAKTDSRVVAADWARVHLASSTSVYQAGTWERLALPQTRESLERTAEAASGRIGEMKAEMNRLLADRQEATRAFEEWVYVPETRTFAFGHETRHDLPRYIITASSPLRGRGQVPPGIPELLAESYTLRKAFWVTDVNRRDNFYDQQDAFYLPFSGFHGVERPGPNINIYERVQ
jgi:dolichyl-phosphate-mannose-protein mannosyltransferase